MEIVLVVNPQELFHEIQPPRRGQCAAGIREVCHEHHQAHAKENPQQPLARFREAARDIPEQHCDGQHQERRCGEVVVNVRSARHKHPRQELRKRAQEQERHRHIPVGGCPVQRFAILAQGVAVAFCPHEHRVRKADKCCRPNRRVAEAPDCIAPAGGIHIQIILEHWTDVRLRTPAKKINAPIIKEFTGVENYKGKKDQRKKVMEHITVGNFQDMFSRICEMENDDTVVGSSNFDKLVKYLSADDDRWINEINRRLEE